MFSSISGPKNAIPYIGTEILFLPCFATTDMFLFCKKLIFSGIATHWPADKEFLVKTPFWAIIKKTQKFVKAVTAQKFDNQVTAQKLIKKWQKNKNKHKTNTYFGSNSTHTGRKPTIFCMPKSFYIFYGLEVVPGPGEP